MTDLSLIILNYLQKESEIALSLNSLEKKLNIKKSRIHGCLVELQARGFIESFLFKSCRYYKIKEN